MTQMKFLLCCLVLAVLGCAGNPIHTYAADAPWPTIGPYGGDARRIAADPGNSKHLYLGTVSSWLYQSVDGGTSWKRLAKLSKDDNLVIDSIVVDAADPKTILVGAWVFNGTGGSLLISHDAGVTWAAAKDMEGQSVRGLSEAKSDSRVFVAGTLTGVYRSRDHGEHWSLISPEGSKELHEVESIAIDPAGPNTIFAGTWHLPWKTTDGGATWHTIKQGVIDDSDVFSIIVDPKEPATIYASACSGIYKSLDAGENFIKVQGIPATARRTRVLMQDPVNLNVVYAGTTEGLYQTTNAGGQWARLTGPDVVVNDVYIDPANPRHVLMATDRSGVLMSDDSGVTFHDSNDGFSQRQVQALLIDSRTPHMVYAGVLNDKNYGGVFVSGDDGTHWKQQSAGLGGLDVFSLAEAGDGTIFAGTNHGLFRWNGTVWERNGTITAVSTNQPKPEVNPGKHQTKLTSSKHGTSKQSATKHGEAAASIPAGPGAGLKSDNKPKKAAKAGPPMLIESRVNALALEGEVWFAATSAGLYESSDKGVTWQASTGQPVLLSAKTPEKPVTSKSHHSKAAIAIVPPPVPQPGVNYGFVGASGPVVYAASRLTIMRSEDGGATWQSLVPGTLTSVEAFAITPSGQLWIGGREGAFYSDDKGDTWQLLKGLPTAGISGLTYDPGQKRMLLTSWQSNLIFAIDTSDKTWKWWDGGWNIHQVKWLDGRLIGASRFDGVVMQPGGVGDAAAPAGR
ncbi:MAG TPA: transcriptional regulator [Acidisarcina sp.]